MAADPLFREFLVSKAETAKNELSDPNLGVEAVLLKAKEILKIENRVRRIDNPVQRKPKTDAIPA